MLPTSQYLTRLLCTEVLQHYTINKHFYNEKDVEVKVENGETKTG